MSRIYVGCLSIARRSNTLFQVRNAHRNLSSASNWNLPNGRHLRLGPHVREALSNGDPIVALESTVITHGMPEPENLNLALELEQIVTRYGSVPATVGIINGQLVIGLVEEEIEFLSNRRLCNAMKASRRDIPTAIALKKSAGTTVAGTMSIVCSLAQSPGSSGPIKVFATGGTGGVHKGGEQSLDISADLFEFSRSPIGVVSAGFKSFLDARRSLEYLETLGCTVMSLKAHIDNGNSHSTNKQQLFPAFYCSENDEGIFSPLSLDSIQEVASILFECLQGRSLSPTGEQGSIGDCRGAYIAVPIPREFSMQDTNCKANNPGQLNAALKAAIDEIESRQDLQGFEKTPLILAKLNEITNGKSLKANLELLKNNARVGSLIAKEYELISRVNYDNPRGIHRNDKFQPELPNSRLKQENIGPLVIGCTMIDMHVSTKMDQNFRKNKAFSGVTFEGRPHLTVGGVGRNLAVALEFLGCSPSFLTALANDSLGQFACDNLSKNGLQGESSSKDYRLLRIIPSEDNKMIEEDGHSAEATSCFALVLRDSLTGQCEYVIANLNTINAIGRKQVEAQRNLMTRAPLIVLDANLSREALETTIKLGHQLNKPIFIEPTDCLAIPRLTECIKSMSNDRDKADWLSSVVCLSPNLIEFRMMNQLFNGPDESGSIITEPEEVDQKNIDQIETIGRKLMQTHLTKLKCLLITMDKDGVLAISRLPLNSKAIKLLEVNSSDTIGHSGRELHSRYFPVPEPVERTVSGSGAGDSFAAGFVASLIQKQDIQIDDCVRFGFKTARLALMDEDTIPKSLINLRISD